MPVPSPRNAPLAVALLGRGVVDPEQPLLHADDAGVLRGRAAFETMRVYDAVPFRLDGNMAAQREAHRRGADDALFVSAEGIVLEGPTSNVWFSEAGKLCTPGLDLGILAGVTRDTLLAAAAGRGIDVVEDAFAIERLFA